jgi:HAMP domain-containing protein
VNLLVKFNLVLGGTLAAGLVVSAGLAHQFLNRQARAEAVESGRLVMEAARAARAYTSLHVKPLLDAQLKYEFHAESVPAFSAIQLLSGLQKSKLTIGYREVALNPTNPRDRASDWESAVVSRFRQDEQLGEIVGESDTPNGPMLYLARPIKITDAACLQCHGTADTAPPTMVEKYGGVNGFGWQLNETIGAQIVAMPSTEHRERAMSAWQNNALLTLGAVFGVAFVALNVMLMLLVIRPVRRLAAMTEKVSLEDDSTERFEAKGNDEIAALTRAIDRIRTSLSRAMAMLES